MRACRSIILFDFVSLSRLSPRFSLTKVKVPRRGLTSDHPTRIERWWHGGRSVTEKEVFGRLMTENLMFHFPGFHYVIILTPETAPPLVSAGHRNHHLHIQNRDAPFKTDISPSFLNWQMAD